MAEKIPSWPKVTIRLHDDRNAEVTIAGRTHPVSNHRDPRQAAISVVSDRAAQLGRPVRATAVESDGSSWPLIVHPDGRVDAVDSESRSSTSSGGARRPGWPVIAGIALAVVLIAGTTLYFTVFRDGDSDAAKPSEAPKVPTLPEPKVVPDQFSARPVPPGWSTKASWTVDIATKSAPAVSPDGKQVAILTPDEKVAVFDGNGKVLWQDKVPKDAQSPVYTTIDSKPVLAVAAPDALYYWAGGGAGATSVELPDQAQVQFFGTSPLIKVEGDAGASMVAGGKLKAVANQPRLSTVLLAESSKALMARYTGPLFWSQLDKGLQTVNPKAPSGSKGIEHVVAASPGRALVLWKSATKDIVIPVVHSTVNGAVLATCPVAKEADVESWQWVPDQTGNVAAWGNCVIDFAHKSTARYTDFQPVSVTGTTIYGMVGNDLVATTPGGKGQTLPADTARPWGVADGRALVVHDSTLYALDKK
ncbi:hypothetical protein ACIBG5_28810 [Kribbella sp. NPDC050241]|uniref:hypothetical protein n=1 Tax=Kribbella sp. NPDC050241 TaxID=3364115 RepID=UPI0037920064